MSPTIPPVLVLSLLLVSPLPLAEAGRSTDLFALIRGTLKYWRRIYKIYEEEVVLGYCWADYFLHRDDATTTDTPMTPSMIIDSTNFLGVDIFEGGKRKDLDAAHISVGGSWRFARDKRSYETASITKNSAALSENVQRKGYRWLDAGKKSWNFNVYPTSTERINLDQNGETMGDSLARLIWVDSEQERNRAKRSYDATRKGILEILGGYVGNRVKKTVDSDGSLENVDGDRSNSWIKNVEFVKHNSSSFDWMNRNRKEGERNVETEKDSVDHSFEEFTNSTEKFFRKIVTTPYLTSNNYNLFSDARFPQQNVLNAILQSMKTMMEKVFENVEKTLKPSSNTHLVHARKERTSKVFKLTENRAKISFTKPNSSSKRKDRIQKTTFSSADFLNASKTDGQGSSDTKNFLTHRRDQSAVDKKAVRGSKILKAKVPSKIRTDCQSCRGPLTGRNIKEHSPPPFSRFSSHKLNPPIYRENRDDGTITIDGKKPKRKHAGLSEKSSSPRLAARGILLRSGSNDVTSGTSQTRGTNPSLGARFEDTRPSEGAEDNSDPGDHSRRKSYASSNLGFPSVPARGGFRGNYRRNLRRKRDANDRIRSRRGRLGSSYNSTSVDEIPRCSTSHVPAVYGTPATQIRSRSAMDPGKRRSTAKNDNIGPCRFEARGRKSIAVNCETTTARSSSEVDVDSIERKSAYPRTFSTRRWWFGRRAIGQETVEETGRGETRENDSKQLATTRDNRYRTRNGLHVENSTGRGRTGKKRAATAPYPMGRGSLLPVSQPRFMRDYGNSTGVTARNSRIGRSSRVEDQGRQSSVTRDVARRGVGREFATVFHLRQAFMGFLKALGIFVHVGRQLVDYVESNSALACTKDYLVGKAVQWIDS